MYEPATVQYLCHSSRYNVHVYTCVLRELLKMIVTKLWLLRGIKICVGIVRGHVCVGTVCVALLGAPWWVYCVGKYTCGSSYPGYILHSLT